MSIAPRSYLMKQVGHVRRRMRNRMVLRYLPFGFTVVLLCWALFLITRAFLPAALTGWPLWAEGGTVFTLGIVLAIILGVRRAPSVQEAALAIDQECGLRERVISALTLPGELSDTSVGQAVLEDARQKLAQADLHRPFGPRQRGRDYLWPLLAGGLALGAFFLGPRLGTWLSPASAEDRPVVNAADVQLQLDALRKVSAFQKNEDLPPNKEMEDLGAEWDKLINKPIDHANQDQVRERAREIEDFKNKVKEMADRMEGKGKEVEDALAKLQADKAEGKKGAADELAKALAKGDFGKAAEAVERLRKKMKEKGLGKEEEEKLAEQLKDLEQRLKRLADPKEQREQLAKDHKEGKINDAELQRELDQLAELEKNLQDLKDLADALKDLQEQLGKDLPMALEKMDKLLADLKKLEGQKGDLKKLEEQMRRLEEARMALCQLCQGKDGKKGNGMGGGPKPGGKRPIAKEDPDGKVASSPGRAKVDPKGKLHATGTGGAGGSFAKIPAKAVGGVIEQAVQEAPELIERQRIPPEAADLARGYFRKLGGQK